MYYLIYKEDPIRVIFQSENQHQLQEMIKCATEHYWKYQIIESFDNKKEGELTKFETKVVETLEEIPKLKYFLKDVSDQIKELTKMTKMLVGEMDRINAYRAMKAIEESK